MSSQSTVLISADLDENLFGLRENMMDNDSDVVDFHVQAIQELPVNNSNTYVSNDTPQILSEVSVAFTGDESNDESYSSMIEDLEPSQASEGFSDINMVKVDDVTSSLDELTVVVGDMDTTEGIAHIEQRSKDWVNTSWKPRPFLVILFSVLMDGVGHIYIGQTLKGFAMMVNVIGVVTATIIIDFVCSWIGILNIVLFTFSLFVVIVTLLYKWMVLYDLVKLANRLKREVPVMIGECSNVWILISVQPYFAKSSHPAFAWNSPPARIPAEWTDVVGSVDESKP